MPWILLAVVLAIPAWLGITRPGTETHVRRWVGHCLLGGIAVGAVVSGMMWLGSVHIHTGSSLLLGPMIGGSAGAAVGLLTAAVWLVIARWRKGRSSSPAA